jgi:hypothetical protein
MSILYRGPSIVSVSVHLDKRFQRRRFLKIGLSETRIDCGSHACSFLDASYQISVHLGKRFQRRRFFRYQPIRNKHCLRWPCMSTDQNEISNTYRGPSIDASFQVSVHLAKQFQRRRFLEIDQSETRTACGGHVC